jgi:hypothetical protein
MLYLSPFPQNLLQSGNHPDQMLRYLSLHAHDSGMPEEVNQPAPKDPDLRQLFVFEQPARRVELLVRIVYWIAIGIVLWVYGILAFICLFIQWFVILILGHRNKDLSDFARGYLEYSVHVMPYMYIMTDQRPAILPVKVRIYEEGPIPEGK